MDNFTVKDKRNVLRSSFLIKLCTFLILSLFAPKIYAQLDVIHYVPPLYAGTKLPVEVGRHWVVLTTPSETEITVVITKGNGDVLATVPGVSKATPQKFDLGTGSPTSPPFGVINYKKLNKVISDQGLIFTSHNAAGKSVAFYVNIRHKSQIHGLSLTAKGQAALGRSFRSGHIYSVRGEDNLYGWGGVWYWSSYENRWLENNSNYVDSRSHFISVMATEDNTQVAFSNIKVGNLTSNTKEALPVTGDINVTLNAGESYVIGADFKFLTPDDVNKFNGTKVTSDKPIVMNSGSWCGGASLNPWQDIGVDQIVPEKLVGREYILLKGKGNSETERPIVVATQDNTDVFVNGSTSKITTLNAGDSYAIPTSLFRDDVMLIKTSKNAYLYQTTSGSNINETQQYATVGMNFIPPLSALGFRQVDIPFINELGTGVIAIYAQKGAKVYINGSRTALKSPLAVTGNDEWVVYKYSTSDINVSVQSNKAIYVAMSVEDIPVGAAGYFSGFTKSISPIDTTLVFNRDLGYVCSSQNGNLDLKINSKPIPDWYDWYHDVIHPDSIKFKNEDLIIPIPDEPTKYILRAYFRDPNMDILYNGDFSLGYGSFDTNLDFFESPRLEDFGSAILASNPKTVQTSFEDFPDLDGVGKMLLAHSSGNGRGDIIWQQTIINSTDIPNHLFILKLYGRLAQAGGDQNLDVYVNDERIINKFNINNVKEWQSIKGFWRAGSEETAVLKIVDANATGERSVFAVDSISFIPAIEAKMEFNPDIVPTYSYSPYDQGLHICEGVDEAVADISYGEMGWFSFLWERKQEDGSYGAITDPDISGVETYKLTFAHVEENQEGIYRCTINFREDYAECGIGADPTSVIVKVFVDEPARIEPLQGKTELCEGVSTDITAKIEGDFSVIKWTVFDKNDVGVIKEEKQNNLNIFKFNSNSDYPAGVYTVRCEVINGCSTDLIEEIDINILPKAKLEDLDIPTNLCEIKENTLNAKLVGDYTPENSTLEYTWYKNGSEMGNTSVSTYAITPKIGDESYRVELNTHYNFGETNQFTCKGNSIEKNLVDYPIDPEIKIIDLVPVTRCEGESTTYHVELETPSLSYIYSWNVPEGAKVDKLPTDFTSHSFSLDPISLDMAGDYTVTVSNNCDSKNTMSTLTVNPLLLVSGVTPSKVGPYCLGDEVIFTINDNGQASSYIAKNLRTDETRSSVTNIFTIKADASTEGQWQVTALNLCGDKEISFTIDLADEFSTPTIVDRESCVGYNVTLEAIVETLPVGLTYQWKDQLGNDIDGETSSTLEFTSVKMTDAGEYTCVVTGICSTKEAKGTLSVDDITSNLKPESVNVCIGDLYRFDITYGGNPTFAWYFKGLDGVVKNLGTNSFYQIEKVSTNDEGLYYCIINSACGEERFEQTLNLLENVTVTKDPNVILDVCEKEQTELIIDVTGSYTSVKWYKDGNELTDEAGKRAIVTGKLETSGTFEYKYIVEGRCGDVEGIFNVIVHKKPSITVEDITSCEGDIPLIMKVTGDDYVQASWLNSDNSLLGNGLSATIVDAKYATSQGNYTAKLTTEFCKDITKVAEIRIYEPISLLRPVKQNVVVCLGDELDLVVEGKGSALSYEWYKSPDFNTPIYNGKNYHLDETDILAGGVYKCKLISDYGCNGLEVDIHVKIQEQPTFLIDDFNACSTDGPAIFDATATGDGDYEYKWYKNNETNAIGKTAELKIEDIVSNSGNSYQCEVTDLVCGTIKTKSVNLIVKEDVSITKDPQDITISESGTATFTVEAEGTGLEYQWYENDKKIAGETGSSLIIKSVGNNLNGFEYKCLVSNECSHTETSAVVKLIIDPKIKIMKQPVPLVVCEGDRVEFTIEHLALITNQRCSWEYNDGSTFKPVDLDGFNIISESVNGYVVSRLIIKQAEQNWNGYLFRARVQGLTSSEDDISNAVKLKVDIPAQFSIIGETLICKDAGASFNVNISSGSTPNTYVWKNDGSSIGQNSSLNLTAIVDIDKLYSVGVTAGVCPAVTETFNITHYPDLVLKDLVHDNTLCPEGKIDLTVETEVGSSVPETYVWSKDGSDILGANAVSYNKSDVTDTDAGLYKVTVEDKCMTRSKSINIDVLDVITATTTWKNDTLCVGDALFLETKVTGDNPVYKWTLPPASTRKIENGSSLRIDKVLTTDAGTYTCDITGSCGTARYTVNISINDVPKITTDLDLSAVCVGEELKLGPIAYDLTTNTTIDERIIWKFNDGVIDGVIDGETDLSLDLGTADLDPSEKGNYRVEVSNVCGADYSIGYQDIHPLPTLLPIDNQIACQGENVIFKAEATGENLIYSWFVDDVAVAAALDGKSELVLSDIQPTDVNTTKIYAIKCIVSSCDTDVTETANLTVNPNTILKKAIKGDVVYIGSDYTFKLDVTGHNLKFKWRHVNTAGDGKELDSNLKETLILKELSMDDAGEYSCTITGDCGVRFTSGYLIVKDPIKLVDGFDTDKIEKCFGEPLNLSLRVKGKVFNTNWFKVVGEKEESLNHHKLNYSIPSLDISDNGKYRCVIEGEGTTITQEIDVIVNETTVLKSHLSDKILCETDHLEWIPNVTGSKLTYNWKHNGEPIKDLDYNKASLEMENLKLNDAGVYSVDIHGECGDVSSKANLSLLKLPYFISKTDGDIVCENTDEFVFSVVYGGDDLEYQWQKNNKDIPGANRSIYKLQNIRPDDAGIYKCIVTSSSCGKADIDAEIELKVTPQLKILDEGHGVVVCDGGDALFEIEVESNTVAYQWFKDGEILPEENSSSLTINPARLTDDAYYNCMVKDACTDATYTNAKRLKVNPLPNSQIIGRMTLCVLEDRVAYNTPAIPNQEYEWGVNGGEFTTPTEGLRTKITWGDVVVDSNKISINIMNEATGCYLVLDSAVTLRKLPDVNLNSDSLKTRGICEKEFYLSGGSSSLDAVGTGIYWVDGIAQNTFSPIEKGNGEYKVRYSYTDDHGCSNTTKELVLKVDSLPVVKIMDDVTVGACGKTQLSASTKEDNIRWSPGSFLNDRDSENPTFTAGESTLYVASVIDKHGCVGNDIINVTVAPLPLITTINDTIIGECKEIELTTVISGDIEKINWTHASDLDEPNNSNPKLVKRQVGVNNYQIDVTDKYGCVASGSVKVEVLPNPEVGENVNLCEGDTLIIDTKNLSNPMWNDGYSAWERTITEPREVDYVLTVEQNDCKLSQKIVMNPLPAFKLDNTVEPGIVIFEGQTITLEPDLDPFTHDYVWSDGSILPRLDVSESGLYKLRVEDNIGCFATDSVEVLVKPVGIESPNAFTPLSENENDRFYLKDINVTDDFEMYIYNRWGELLYKTKEGGYAAGWDGTYRGEDCPIGTYVWIVLLDGKEKARGTVTLLR